MRFTTLNDLILALCQEAYNYALQDSQFTPTDIHYLMDPLSRRSLLNKFVDDSITKHVQALLQ